MNTEHETPPQEDQAQVAVEEQVTPVEEIEEEPRPAPPAYQMGPEEQLTRWQAFLRYYVFISTPAAYREIEEQEKAARKAQKQKRLKAQPEPALQQHAVAAQAAEHVHHPPYLQVFGWLIVLTAIEVTPIFTEILFDWTPIPHVIWVPVLLVLAIIKATLVAMYYMHLKYDQPWLVWALMGPLAFAMMFGLVIVAG
jgi:caa(3)-type oxidase subunit IV